MILVGQCPRCGDVMEYPYVDKVFRGIWPLGPSSLRTPQPPELVPMICTCRIDHVGRPPGEDGCGAYWNVTLAETDS